MARKAIAKRNKVNKYLKLVAKVSGLIAVLTVCTLTFGLCFSIYAKKIPILKDAYERIFLPSSLGNY
ncbi:hypothetical protein [uncultured Clostridium sp.]|uniref:hypothetical protein n=1 Tax=uncultured Clostridium sp. TaxID=59620 RepID=UPI0025DBFA15|nr:hypothetical protein [uncultured Clostridium sp.]